MDDRLRCLASSVRSTLEEITQSSNYYVTEELFREMSAINSCLLHLGFDSELMENSTGWPKDFRREKVVCDRESVAAVLSNGMRTLEEYKSMMTKDKLSTFQENQLREIHNDFHGKLRSFLGALEPYARGAYSRVQNFSDYIGVSDRFRGYRHNLTRGPQDYWDQYHTVSDDKRQCPQASASCTPDWKCASGPCDGAAMGDQSCCNQQSKLENGMMRFRTDTMPNNITVQARMSAGGEVTRRYIGTSGASPLGDRPQYEASTGYCPRQAPCSQRNRAEECGIVTSFPGTSEHTDRYIPPAQAGYRGPSNINPAPWYTSHERPMGTSNYAPTESEYQNRYTRPDGSFLDKLPWLRSQETK